MIQLSLRHNFTLLESTMMTLARDLHGKAARVALTRTVTAARRDVMEELPKVFDRPTRFTVNSVRYQMATVENRASVFISDDAAKGLSPRRYLQAEIEGGERGFKRSEKALQRKGLMRADQQLVPGHAAKLDAFGNLPGSTMVQLLSKLTALGEQGYRANASDATKRRLARLKRAVRATGTDVFVGYAKRDGEPLAVYQLVASGLVRPVLAFIDKRPNYKPRFDFHGLVEKSAQGHWPGEMARAMAELLARKR